ncbi:glycosyltransferase family 2 protein [Nonlabens sp. MIC269]|uniref:glycosyltransferase family 2 protein n=1 Tax=Nonlabens sp. MIC269 TaxID=1476901 RepID=UPI00155DEF65|nr:glycosyltransferase family 2 protein [Nonlabens sp. MIC269]
MSIIIPAYNAAQFISRAIQSVLEQPETAEVLVINDGSTDETKNIVYSFKDDRVSLLEHENGINKGRSASRNLGLLNATCDYIAFLDADDYFLANRFSKDKTVFDSHQDCGAVYNAVGYDVRNNQYDYLKNRLYTVTEEVPPEQLFLGLVDGVFGHFQIDGFTIKREVLKSSGLFNEQLAVAEDTDFFWRVILATPTYSSNIDNPVAMRIVHDNNSFYREDLYQGYDYMAYESVIKWASQNSVKTEVIDRILRRVWIIKHKENTGLWNEIKYWWRVHTLHYRLFFSKLNLKYFPLVRRRKQILSFIYPKSS